MQVNVNSWIAGIWVVVGAFWFLSALSRKRTIRTQTSRSRLIQSGLIILSFLLLTQRVSDRGPLSARFISNSAPAAFLGLALTLCGAALAIWARLTLGRNWSGIVTIKENHELVRRGPYAIVRHPIYTGALLALAGTAIALGEIRALIAFGLAFAALWLKMKTEEAFMRQQFGGQYAEYKRRVKRLIPFVL